MILCSTCSTYKHLNEFYPSTVRNNGKGVCKLCHSTKIKKYLTSDKGKMNRTATNKKYSSKASVKLKAYLYNKSDRRKVTLNAYKQTLSYKLSSAKNCHMDRSKGKITVCDFSLDELRQLLSTQNFSCVLCGKEFKDNNFTFDHIIPVAHNGSFTLSNIQLLCKPCNNKKLDRTNEEYYLYLTKLTEEKGRKFLTSKQKQFLINRKNKQFRRNYDKTIKGKISSAKKRHKRSCTNPSTIVDFNEKDWLSLLEEQNNKCKICSKKFNDQILVDKTTIDHVVSIYEGGDFTKSNLQLLCLSCNSRKSSKDNKHCQELLIKEDFYAKEAKTSLIPRRTPQSKD